MNNNKTIVDPIGILPYSKWLEEEPKYPEKPQEHDIIYTGSIENDPLYRKSTIK